MVNAGRMGGTPLMMRMKTALFNRTAANMGLIALLWLLCTLTIPDPLQAAVFFDSDFETCNVGTGNDFPCEGWDDFGLEFINAPNHNKLEIATDLPFTGSKVVKNTFVNNIAIPGFSCALENPSIYKSFQTSDHIFTRHVMRKSPGFLIGSSNSTKFRRWRANSSSGYPVISALMYNNNHILVVEGGYGMGTVLYQGGPPVSSTAWDQVEAEIKMNTPGQSDGILRLWVNGTLYVERLNLQLRGPAPTSVSSQGLLVPSTAAFNVDQIFIQCGQGNIFVDRLAVGNTRIGPIQSGSADSTPPARPTLNPIP
jgi:hypothetical protein